MFNLNQISVDDAELIHKALAVYATELQAEIDYRHDALHDLFHPAIDDEDDLKEQFIDEIEYKSDALNAATTLGSNLHSLIVNWPQDKS